MDADRRLLGATYRSYGASARKRRAWSAENRGNVAIRAELSAAVFDLAGRELRGARQILDIGCGTGWWLAHLAADKRVGGALHGVDLLPERAAAARRRIPAAAVVVGDVRALPYPSAGFEAVTAFTLLSSLPSRRDVALALAQARRVLAPGGVLIVWEPRWPNPLNRATLLVDRRLLARGLAGARTRTRTTTVVPALARRLGAATDRAYPDLARIPALRTHRLVCAWL